MEVAALGLKVDGVSNIDQASGALGKFRSSADRAQDAADGLGSSSAKAKKPIDEVGSSSRSAAADMSSMGAAASKAGAFIVAAFSVGALKTYADTWSDMQSKVGAATGDMDGAADRMQRIVDIANASYSPLSQTAEVYSRNVATFRDLGRNADEAADFTEALNHALVVTATKGQDADVVINSLSRSLAIGKLDADAFDTIVSRSPRTLQAMADAMGVTTSEVRKLATEGKVTGEIIANSLIGSLDQLRNEAAEMPATVGDAFVRVNTTIGALVGSLDKATGSSGAFAGVIISMADSVRDFTKDADAMASIVTAIEVSAIAAAAAMSGKLTASIVESMVATAKSIAATKAKSVADLDSANAASRLAIVEKEAAASALARANALVKQAETKVASDRMAIASEAERLRFTQAALVAEKALEVQRLQAQISDIGRSQSLARLAEIRLAEIAIIKQAEASERSLAATTVASSAVMQAAYAERTAAATASAAAMTAANRAAAGVTTATTAVKAATVATGALAVTARAASAAMAFLGGPLGVALAAASAIAYFAMRSNEAKTSSDNLTASVGALSTAAERAERNFAHLTAGVDKLNKKELTLRTTQIESSLSKAQRDLTRYERLFEKGNTSITVGLIDQTKANIGFLNKELEQLKQRNTDAASGGTEEGQKRIASMQQELALLGVTGEARARLAALQRLGDKATEAERAEVESLAIEIYRLDEAQRSVGKSTKDNTAETNRSAEAIASQISALERAREIWGMSEDAVVLYDLAQQGATKTQLAYASGLLETVSALEAEKEAQEKAAEARKSAGEAFDKVVSDVALSGSGNREIDELNILYEDRKNVIAEALATEYATQQEHDLAMIDLERVTAAQRKQINDDYLAEQQANQLQSMESIVSVTQGQIAQMQGLFDEGTAIGKAFYVATQALAAANAVIQGFQSAMAIRVAYAQMAAMSGPAAPAILAAGEVHANVAQGMGFVTAGLIAAQTVSGFKDGGYTGSIGANNVAGVVHGNEFVFDAAATSRIGIPTLEAIQAGRPVNTGSSSSAGSSSGRGGVVVNQNNYINGSDGNRTANQIANATARKERIAVARLG